MRTDVARVARPRVEPFRHRAGDHRQAAARRAPHPRASGVLQAAPACRGQEDRLARRRPRPARARRLPIRRLAPARRPRRPDRVAAALARAHGRHVRVGSLAVAAAAMALAAVVSVRWGAFAIGGSDSHCYAGQARMFAEGRTSLAPAARAARAVAERGGHVRAVRLRAGAGPGRRVGAAVRRRPRRWRWPRAMRIAGDAAIFAVVPLLGVLAVWSTWLLGRRLAGPARGRRVGAARRMQPDLPLPARAAHERRAGGRAVDRCAGHRARPGRARAAGIAPGARRGPRSPAPPS